jgi:hypothetical protein
MRETREKTKFNLENRLGVAIANFVKLLSETITSPKLTQSKNAELSEKKIMISWLTFNEGFSRFQISKILLTVFAWSWGLPVLAQGQVLITPNFRIEIERLCPEGYVVCNNIRYISTDRKTGSSINLMGRSHHTIGADGVTPSRFLGYIFENGEYKYIISTEGHLRILQGETVILEEKGEWQ